MEILDFFLPTEILRQKFALYLSTKDVSRFDRAMCNKVKRSTFLFFMESNSIVLSGCYDRKNILGFLNQSKYLTWLKLRGVKVNHFTCRGTLDCLMADKIAALGTSLFSLQLKIDSFKESKSIDIPSFTKIIKSCTGLTSLQLGRFKVSSAIPVIIEYCPGIKILEVCGDGNSSSTDASMLKLAEGCPQLESLTFLQSRSGIFSNAFMRFVDSCPRLTTLNLSENQLTDAILCTIVESSRDLIDLNINRNKLLTDSTLFGLANNCKQLKTLDISENNLPTDASLIKLAENCKQLQTLDISGNSHYYETSLYFLIKSCSQLRSLRVSTFRFIHVKLQRNFPRIDFGCYQSFSDYY
jgi:hypothetical protein